MRFNLPYVFFSLDDVVEYRALHEEVDEVDEEIERYRYVS
jgi:hypothetical protein